MKIALKWFECNCTLYQYSLNEDFWCLHLKLILLFIFPHLATICSLAKPNVELIECSKLPYRRLHASESIKTLKHSLSLAIKTTRPKKKKSISPFLSAYLRSSRQGNESRRVTQTSHYPETFCCSLSCCYKQWMWSGHIRGITELSFRWKQEL